MRLTRFAPSAELAPYVQSYEIVETTAGVLRALVPETGLVVGFRYSGSSSLLEGATRRELPSAVVTGLRDTTRRMLTAPESGIALIKFRPAGAAPFLEGPLHRLFGGTAALETVIDPREVAWISARIAGAPSHVERVRAIEELLLERARRRRSREDGPIAAALAAIEADPGGARVGRLARELGLSVDALEKRFRRTVGSSPKQLASILRLRRAFEAQRAGATLTEVAFEAGYYDQSHFSRRFAAAAGMPPREFFRTTEHC